MKYLFKAPSLIGKLAKWLIFVTEIDVEYLTKKTVNGRTVIKFLVLNPISDNQKIKLEFLDDFTTIIEI